jgi:purine-binding chemotaxis protein CheW
MRDDVSGGGGPARSSEALGGGLDARDVAAAGGAGVGGGAAAAQRVERRAERPEVQQVGPQEAQLEEERAEQRAEQRDARREAQLVATHLLVRAGEYVCALPLSAVRRVVRALPLHPLPGSAPELRGLAEFGGDPLPVLDLARLARAPQGANPAHPVTVVAWAGAGSERELVGLAADAALDVAHLAAAGMVGGDGGVVAGEAVVAGQVVRVIDLQALGQGAAAAR